MSLSAADMLLVVCRAGSVCLDVINQTWSPMFGELLSISIRDFAPDDAATVQAILECSKVRLACPALICVVAAEQGPGVCRSAQCV